MTIKTLLPLFIFLILIASVRPTYAALTINPSGSWKVTSPGASGSVGDVVTVELSITFLTDSSADTDFSIKTSGEAREKLSFVSVTPTTGNPSVSAEQIDWPKTEFEAGVTKKYQLKVRIDRGAIGDEIEGFYISTYTGKSIMFGVADDITVKIIAKSSPTPTLVVTNVTPAPTSITVSPSLAIPTSQPTTPSVVVVYPTSIPTSTPINPIDPDGDGLPNDQEAIWGSNPYVFDTDADGMPDGDEIRNGTNPAGDAANVNTMHIGTPIPTPLAPIEPLPSPLVPKQSFFNYVVSSIQEGLQAIGNWFIELF